MCLQRARSRSASPDEEGCKTLPQVQSTSPRWTPALIERVSLAIFIDVPICIRSFSKLLIGEHASEVREAKSNARAIDRHRNAGRPGSISARHGCLETIPVSSALCPAIARSSERPQWCIQRAASIFCGPDSACLLHTNMTTVVYTSRRLS
jgi:hypothetical protein